MKKNLQWLTYLSCVALCGVAANAFAVREYEAWNYCGADTGFIMIGAGEFSTGCTRNSMFNVFDCGSGTSVYVTTITVRVPTPGCVTA